jgi:MoaA/NifB/PqqE/SkfB family radical SAM enzyme
MTKYNVDTHCSLAFSGFDTRAKSTCCWAKLSSAPATFDELKNLEEIKNLQQDLINGVKNSLCQQCWSDESLGLRSMRQGFLPKSTDGIQLEIQEKKLKYLTIDSGNVCNLACRTCGPGSISSFFKEYEVKKLKFPYHNNYQNLTYVKKTDVDYLIAEDFSQIEIINILGGEPFQNLEHLQILETIIKQGYAKNCTLSYVTNGTVNLPNKIKNILYQFKHVSITLSIDAVGEQFEYIRTNGVWNTLLTNVEDFKLMSGNQPSIKLNAHPTVSALNILYLDELYAWYESNNFYHTIVLCKRPQHYSFTIFNDQQKKIIIDQLKNSRFDMSSIIKHIEDVEFDATSLQQFYKEVEFTQDFKKLDINHYLPRLMTLLAT